MRRLAAIAAAAALAVPASVAVGNGSAPPARSAAATQSAASAASTEEGRKLFTGGTTPTCATCHTLRDADATGAIGPDLDALDPDAQRVRAAVERGFENMPAFGHVLSKAQIEALALYVESVAGPR